MNIDKILLLIKLITISLIFVILISCYKWPDTPNEFEEKKIRASKINIRLGMIYLEKNDVRRAKHKFLLALDEAPNTPEPWYGMGYFLETTGNVEQAEKYYLKSVSLAPIRGDALNNYGTYLCRTGHYSHSIQYFIEAATDPHYLDPAAAYENAGFCALKIPDRKMAMQFFYRVLMEDPHRPRTLMTMAELNYEAKHYLLARRELKQFLQLSPPTPQSYILEKNIDAKLSR